MRHEGMRIRKPKFIRGATETRKLKTVKHCHLQTHLWAHRFASGMTQQQLAERVGVSRYAIHKVESGKTVPSVLMALCIAKELGAKVEDIFRLE